MSFRGFDSTEILTKSNQNRVMTLVRSGFELTDRLIFFKKIYIKNKFKIIKFKTPLKQCDI